MLKVFTEVWISKNLLKFGYQKFYWNLDIKKFTEIWILKKFTEIWILEKCAKMCILKGFVKDRQRIPSLVKIGKYERAIYLETA